MPVTDKSTWTFENYASDDRLIIRSGEFYAKMILRTKGSNVGRDITTVELRYPSIVHPEVLTHRDRARNSASTRAVPFVKARENCQFVPIHWGLEQGGMQCPDEIPEPLRPLAREIWKLAAKNAVEIAGLLQDLGRTASRMHRADDLPNGFASAVVNALSYDEIVAVQRWLGETEKPEEYRVHKSIPSRIFQPFGYQTIVMTATDWENFFRLRCHPDAEHHFQQIALMTRELLDQCPGWPSADEWHLPYVTGFDYASAKQEITDVLGTGTDHFSVRMTLARVSCARAARVCYLTHDGKRDVQADLKLYDKLAVGSEFGHWSPSEHAAERSYASQKFGCMQGWCTLRAMEDRLSYE